MVTTRTIARNDYAREFRMIGKSLIVLATAAATAVERAFQRLGFPPAQTTSGIVQAPHSVFADSTSRRALAERLRTWIR